MDKVRVRDARVVQNRAVGWSGRKSEVTVERRIRAKSVWVSKEVHSVGTGSVFDPGPMTSTSSITHFEVDVTVSAAHGTRPGRYVSYGPGGAVLVQVT